MGPPRLRRSITEPRRAHLWLRDAVSAAAVLAIGLLLIALGLVDTWADLGMERFAGTSPLWHVLFLALGCAAMLVKRRLPVPALLAGSAATAADLAFGGSLGIILVLFDLLYAVGLHAGAGARNAVSTVVFVGVGTTSVVAGLATGDVRATVMVALQLTGLLVVPLWWAGNLRQQRQLTALATARARSEERAAMARDLHDVIASHLSTSAIQSGAALALPPDEERDRSVLRAIRAGSLSALEEMRAMIVLLRGDPAAAQERPTAPPRLDRLDELIAIVEAAGLRVRAEVAIDAELPALVDQAAYRIVQEALHNAAKHAPGTWARLRITLRDDRLVIETVNPLPHAIEPRGPVPSTGTGLWSMRERAALIGGGLEAGPDGGHWRVRATLPVPAQAGVPR